MGERTGPVTTRPNTQGRGTGHTQTSPVQNIVRAQVVAQPARVIPIIFVPGIMGSNLRTIRAVKSANFDIDFAAGQAVWRIDSTIGFARRWAGKSAAQRQLLINHGNLEADTRGEVGASSQRLTPVRKDRVRKGWGTVSWVFYGGIMEWLSDRLDLLGLWDGVPTPDLAAMLKLANTVPVGASASLPPLTEPMIKKLLNFSFPIYACGYNWAASNLDSGAKLAATIKETITYHHNRNGQTCNQVILITHSMGGLVARAASQTSGAASKILGVIHGVMPTHGAAAMYKRATLGFGNESAGFWGFIPGEIASYALGYTAAETTPVLAYNAGPLELAPNHRYNDGKPWLFIKNAQGVTLKAMPVSGDPYTEIYANTTDWWRAVHPRYLNPANLKINGLVDFSKTLAKAKSYHDRLADGLGFHSNTYTHYGIDPRHATWGTLTWRVTASTLYVPPSMGVGPYSGISIPQRLNEPSRAIAGTPESWSISAHDGARGFLLVDTEHAEVSVTVEPKDAPGDGTVPASASAAGADGYSKIVLRHTDGYEHDKDYKDERVRASLLDAIVRMIQPLAV